MTPTMWFIAGFAAAYLVSFLVCLGFVGLATWYARWDERAQDRDAVEALIEETACSR